MERYKTIHENKVMINPPKEKLKITFKEWHYQCGDKCCDNYGTRLSLNDKELEHPNEEILDNGYVGEDIQTALHAVLKELGYEVEFDNESI